MNATFIEVMGWGDFDIKITKALLYTEEKRDVKSILETYCSLKGLPKPNKLSVQGIDWRKLGSTADDFINYLKKKENFKTVKTESIAFID